MTTKKHFLIQFGIIFFNGISEKRAFDKENVEKVAEKDFVHQNEFMNITRNIFRRNYCTPPNNLSFANLDLKQLFRQYNVKGLSTSSKTIQNNEAFFAIKGYDFDGNNFINDALRNHAILVITENKTSIDINPDRVIYEPNIQKALHEAIEIFHPQQPRTLIAVTGTNGKSSVVSYIAQLYSLLEKKSASVGTLGVKIFGCDNFTSTIKAPALTTLDYLNFRKISQNLAQNGIEYLAFEASSHGLDQGRLGDTKVKVACFTSFSQDHLDYHKTEENYLSAKLKLFTQHLSSDGLAILDSQINGIEFIKDYLSNRSIKYMTVGKNGDLQITKIHSSLQGQSINFKFNNKEYNLNTSIIGSFQATNLLIAGLSVNYTGFEFDSFEHFLSHIEPVQGRMSRIENTNIFVDYCHTPDALEKVLQELKNIKLRDSKLNVVFGCGGTRDKTKRSIMGQIAAKIANFVIITDDNPRFEDPKIIRKEIIGGINGTNYIEIAGREDAME